jgi:hypothetical protein
VHVPLICVVTCNDPFFHVEYHAGTSGSTAAKKRCALGTLPAAGKAACSSGNQQQSLSVLVMPQGVDGTLLDLINAHKAADKPIGEALVLYISLQMLLVRACMALPAVMVHHSCIVPTVSPTCTALRRPSAYIGKRAPHCTFVVLCWQVHRIVFYGWEQETATGNSATRLACPSTSFH